MQRIEVQHHTPEQVREYIEQALAVVREVELDGELRGLAFVEAVRLLSSKTVQATVAPTGVLLPTPG